MPTQRRKERGRRRLRAVTSENRVRVRRYSAPASRDSFAGIKFVRYTKQYEQNWRMLHPLFMRQAKRSKDINRISYRNKSRAIGGKKRISKMSQNAAIQLARHNREHYLGLIVRSITHVRGQRAYNRKRLTCRDRHIEGLQNRLTDFYHYTRRSNGRLNENGGFLKAELKALLSEIESQVTKGDLKIDSADRSWFYPRVGDLTNGNIDEMDASPEVKNFLHMYRAMTVRLKVREHHNFIIMTERMSPEGKHNFFAKKVMRHKLLEIYLDFMTLLSHGMNTVPLHSNTMHVLESLIMQYIPSHKVTGNIRAFQAGRYASDKAYVTEMIDFLTAKEAAVEVHADVGMPDDENGAPVVRHISGPATVKHEKGERYDSLVYVSSTLSQTKKLKGDLLDAHFMFQENKLLLIKEYAELTQLIWKEMQGSSYDVCMMLVNSKKMAALEKFIERYASEHMSFKLLSMQAMRNIENGMVKEDASHRADEVRKHFGPVVSEFKELVATLSSDARGMVRDSGGYEWHCPPSGEVDTLADNLVGDQHHNPFFSAIASEQRPNGASGSFSRDVEV